ncbi:hypothetical protein HPMBJEAJ_00127 [Aeromonas phage avDM6]|nr:hypothetical protein HPMBJEAJ_00127 [Aeromonas phage avDM6]
MRHFSINQGIEFSPMDLEDQAYLLDNVMMMLDMIEFQLESNPDPVYKHWHSLYKTRYDEICKKVELKR